MSKKRSHFISKHALLVYSIIIPSLFLTLELNQLQFVNPQQSSPFREFNAPEQSHPHDVAAEWAAENLAKYDPVTDKWQEWKLHEEDPQP